MAKLSETLRRKRRLRKKIRAVELGVDLAKNDVPRLDGLPQKMDPKIEVLGALTAADGALRPCNACLVVGKNDRGASLRITEISKKLSEINYLLNHSGSRNVLYLCSR